MEARTNSLKASVIIPIYNRPELLNHCLRSLANQDFRRDLFEVLVCDDGSTVDLRPILEHYDNVFSNLLLLRQDRTRGPGSARNMGFRSGRGSIFVCVDSDIICAPDFLRQLVNALESHPNWVAAEAKITPKGGSESPLWDAPSSNGGIYLSGATAYRGDPLMRVGGFDETFPYYCEDTELGWKLLGLGEFGYAAEAVAYHPRRRVTVRTHWGWRHSWKYVAIQARRYGFLAFPEKDAGPFPRLRVTLAALVTQPAGRFVEGIRYMRKDFVEGSLACFYALLDVLFGTCALPSIFFSGVPERKNYL